MSTVELLPALHWVHTRISNLYLCIDDDGLTLIDTGTPGAFDQVLSAISACGFQAHDLKRIVITHADWDHAGSAAAIQAATGAMVYAGEKTAVYLQNGTSPQHLPAVMQWIANRFVYEAVPEVVPVPIGVSIPVLGGLQAIASPGHTDDHVAFYSPTTGVLFAGDALNMWNGRLSRTPALITADEEAANQSAINLLALSPTIIACGHGKPLQGHDSGMLMKLFNELRAE